MNDYEKLKWKYKFRLLGLFFIGLVIALPIFWYLSMELATYYNIGTGPVKDQPNGWKWVFSILFIMIITMFTCTSLVLIITGIIKKWSRKMTLDIFLCRNYPRHWLK